MPSAELPRRVIGPTKGTVTCERPQYPAPGGPPALANIIAFGSVSNVLLLEKGVLNYRKYFRMFVLSA
jgi:hypothetical protein